MSGSVLQYITISEKISIWSWFWRVMNLSIQSEIENGFLYVERIWEHNQRHYFLTCFTTLDFLEFKRKEVEPKKKI